MQKSITRFMPPIAIIAMLSLYAYRTLSAPYISHGLESVVLPLDFTVGLPAIFYVFAMKAKMLTLLTAIPVIWIGYGLSVVALGLSEAGILPYLLFALVPVEFAITVREIRKIVKVYRPVKASSSDPVT